MRSWLAALLLFLGAVRGDPRETLLRIRVIDEVERPVAGARAWLVEQRHVGSALDHASVLESGSTNAQGELFVPVAIAHLLHGCRGTSVVAYAPGRRVGGRLLDARWLARGDELTIELLPAVSWSVVVEDDEGRPLANARIAPLSMLRSDWYGWLPPEIAFDLSAIADREGHATFDWLGRDEAHHVRISSADGDVWRFAFDPPGSVPERIQLSRSRRIEGEFLPPSSGAISEWKVLAPTLDGNGRSHGFEEFLVDPDGSFTVPATSDDATEISLLVPASSAYLPIERWPDGLVTCGTWDPNFRGQAFLLHPTVEHTGRVIDVHGGHGVAGVRLLLEANGMPRLPVRMEVETNADGVFRFRSVPGLSYSAQLLDLPAPYPWDQHRVDAFAAIAKRSFHDATKVRLGVAERSLPPILLERALSIEGRIAEQDGSPAGDACVVAQGTSDDSIPWGMAWTDESGCFALALPSDARDIVISATKGGRTTERVELSAAGAGPIRLSLAGTIALRGRVVDSSGAPVSSVRVRVADEYLGTEPPEAHARTDERGRFETATAFRAGQAYRFLLEGEGILPLHTPLIANAGGTVGDLLVQRLVGLRGRVTDSAGRPIAGARVFHVGDRRDAIETLSDPDGQFALAGVDASLPILFAEAPGFVLGGVLGAGEAAERTIVLRAEGSDPPEARPWKHLPSVSERRALAREVLAPWRRHVEERGTAQERLRLAWTLALLDVEDAARLLDATEGVSAAAAADLRCAILELARETDPEFTPVGEVWGHPAWASLHVLLELEQAPVAENFEAARRALDRLVEAEEFALHSIAFARAALSSGLASEAAEFLTGAIERVDETGSAPEYRAWRYAHALVVACFDMGAAFRIHKGLSVATSTGERLRNARAALDAQPAAERIEAIRKTLQGATSWSDGSSACREAAGLASSVRIEQPDLARRLFEEILDWVDRCEDRDELGVLSPSLASLLPHAEAVLPERHEELLWLCLALRRGARAGWVDSSSYDEDARLAMAIARHEPEIARALLDHLAPYSESAVAETAAVRARLGFHLEDAIVVPPARAVLDPRAAFTSLRAAVGDAVAPNARSALVRALCQPDLAAYPVQPVVPSKRFRPIRF